jgi:hypothetical protein
MGGPLQKLRLLVLGGLCHPLLQSPLFYCKLSQKCGTLFPSCLSRSLSPSQFLSSQPNATVGGDAAMVLKYTRPTHSILPQTLAPQSLFPSQIIEDGQSIHWPTRDAEPRTAEWEYLGITFPSSRRACNVDTDWDVFDKSRTYVQSCFMILIGPRMERNAGCTVCPFPCCPSCRSTTRARPACFSFCMDVHTVCTMHNTFRTFNVFQ